MSPLRERQVSERQKENDAGSSRAVVAICKEYFRGRLGVPNVPEADVRPLDVDLALLAGAERLAPLVADLDIVHEARETSACRT